MQAQRMEGPMSRELNQRHLAFGRQRRLPGQQRFVRVGVGAPAGLRIKMVQSHL